jgi:hypothetical protein
MRWQGHTPAGADSSHGRAIHRSTTGWASGGAATVVRWPVANLVWTGIDTCTCCVRAHLVSDLVLKHTYIFLASTADSKVWDVA